VPELCNSVIDDETEVSIPRGANRVRTFVGVFEAKSSYRFASDAALRLTAPNGTVEAFTRYINVGVDLPLPGALQLNFKYEQDVAFDAAARTMHSNAISVCEAAALAANCSVGVAQPLFISETTDGLAPPEFINDFRGSRTTRSRSPALLQFLQLRPLLARSSLHQD
jgi:hypothetical protein